MKKLVYILVLFSVVVLSVTCSNGKQSKTESLGKESVEALFDTIRKVSASDPAKALEMLDTLRQQDELSDLYEKLVRQSVQMVSASDPVKALKMLDLLVQQGGVSDFYDKQARSLIYSNSMVEHHLDTALTLSVELLHHDSVVHDLVEQENILNQLIDICRKRRDDELYLKWSIQKAELCRQQGEETELLRTEAEIGLVLTHLGRVDDGLSKLKHSVQQLDVPGSVDKLDAFIVVSKRLITAYNEQDRPAEIVPLVQRVLKRIDDYQSHPSSYAEDSYRLPNVKVDRDRYIDFCKGQSYCNLVLSYAEQGDRQQAYHYLDKLAQTQYGSSFSAQKMLCPAYLILGEYGKLTSTYEILSQKMGSDTINVPYADMLRGYAIMADSRGRTAESRDYWRRYAELYKFLQDSIGKSKVYQYAAHYHAQEQQMELEKQEEMLKRMNLYIWGAVLLAILGIGFAFYFFYRRRIDNQKNQIIVNQITETLKLKQQCLDELENIVDNKKRHPSVDDMNDMSNEELFNYLSSVIMRENLYLDPTFDRMSLMARFHLTARRIGSAFSQGSSEYSTLPGFVREQRLAYACKLMQEHPEMSFKAVAVNSGFSSQTRFNIDFKDRYSFTPSEYLQLMEKKPEKQVSDDSDA